MRSVEEVERAQNPEANCHINEKDSQDVEPADLENFSSQISDAEEKSDCQKEDRESAGINAVDQGRNADKRQEPSAAIAQLPEKIGARTRITEEKENPQDGSDREKKNDNLNF